MNEKIGFIWNTAGSLVYSLLNAVLLAFCTRLNGIEIAGIFSICYATSCILNAVGDMGIRIFQVTDAKRKYKFADYLFSRFFAIALMLVIAIIFVIVSGYTNEKLFICLVLILLRVIDNLSESFQAEFQLNGRLDRAGKTLLYRNSLQILVFAIVDMITKNIYISLISMLLTSIIAFVLYDYRITNKTNKTNKIKIKCNYNNVKQIIMECIPLGISTLINMYVINAVKYAIDKFGNNTMQTYFNVLYMPTFIINLVGILIMKPILKPFGEYWSNREYKRFLKAIAIVLVFLTVITILIEIVAAVAGIPILSFIYGIELEEYKVQLLLLILSGLFYAAATVMFYALGTIRKQKEATICYILSALVAYIVSNILVYKYGIMGSTISSVLIMLVLFILLSIFFIIGYNNGKNGG